jgi:hypothetical protein
MGSASSGLNFNPNSEVQEASDYILYMMYILLDILSEGTSRIRTRVVPDIVMFTGIIIKINQLVRKKLMTFKTEMVG